ncbi:MAG: MotB family protein [Hyphomicrobiales bacterium]|nr:MotB family protein [Hyphomicrobiales bacterium]
MSLGREDMRAPDVIVVRRRGHEDDHPPHGGIWKIAYADFMTAMMAFFLVMWLINTADTKTIGQIATYFNPIKLTNNIPGPKGVHEVIAEEPSGDKKSEKTPKKGEGGKAAADGPKHSEQALFEDPYGILAKLAAEHRTAGGAAPANKKGGEALRDAFDPDFVTAPLDDADLIPRAALKTAPKADAPPSEDMKQVSSETSPEPTTATSKSNPGGIINENDKAKPVAGDGKSGESQAALLRAQLNKALTGVQANTIPDVQVTETAEGVLISLTDQFDFEMFAIGSAEPRPGLIAAMDKIARLLAQQSGKLLVRGHTDGRPYRSKLYDNWRLSSARAHMAHYMLIRGGVGESRFERIEGYGATGLKLPQKPDAAANRRIEILMRTTAQ